MNKRLPFWQRIFRGAETESRDEISPLEAHAPSGEVRPLDIPANDPLLAFVLASPGIIEVEKLTLESPTLEEMRAAGIKIALPLVSQGELIGLLNLGPRMSEHSFRIGPSKISMTWRSVISSAGCARA